jgi:hypothetical protein
MNLSPLIVALFTMMVLGLVLFLMFRAAGRPSGGPGRGRGRKLRKEWRRWLFGEHNIPFS